jgi:SnoaL-like domain
LDGEAFADLFTPDGELWVPDVAADGAPTICRRGREQLSRIPSGLARYHATRHAVGTATYTVDSRTASGEVTGVAHHLRAGPGPGHSGGVDVIWYLRYVDDYVRSGDGWLLDRRVLRLRGIEERALTRLGPGRPRPRGTTSGAGAYAATHEPSRTEP